MATWVTHLMIADSLLQRFPQLDRRDFCVGNIGPDCNVENEDWTAFTPPREVTHWMTGARKKSSDCDAFCKKYILSRQEEILSKGEYAFLLGYYAHLMADAAFQEMIRDANRVKAVWRRIHADEALDRQSTGMEESWDSVKKLIPKQARMAGIYTMEAEYLQRHSNSGYLTEILPLKEYPDYLDYMPSGCIARKVSVMGYLPQANPNADFVALSREEYAAYVQKAIQIITNTFLDKELVL